MKLILLASLFLSFSVRSEVSFKQIFNRLEVSEMKIKNRSYRVPIYNNLEWRLRSDEEGVVTNSLKLEPLAAGQKETIKRLIEQRTKLGKAYSSEIMAEQCLDKNLLLVDLFYAKKSIKLYHKLKLSYQDLTKVLKKGVNRDLLGFSELLKMREKLVSTKLKFNELVLNSRSMLAQLNLPANYKPKRIGNLNFDGFIDVEDIKKKAYFSSSKNIELDKLAATAKIRELDFLSEERADKQVFKHVRLNHQKTLLGKIKSDDSFSVEVAFNIPSGNYQNSQEKMIEWHKARAEYNQAKRNNRSSLALKKESLSIKIRNFMDLNSDGYLKDLNSYLDLLKKSKSNSPFKIVQVKEKILKQEKEILDLRYEITRDYFYSLAEQGKLADCSISYILKDN